jgi:hypothetical protein
MKFDGIIFPILAIGIYDSNISSPLSKLSTKQNS